MPGVSDAQRDEILALLALIRARYGARLDPAALAEIEHAVAASVAAAHALRQVRLDNADGPSPSFVPFRAEP